MKLPIPNQISTDPQVNNEALGWSQVLVDGLGKIRISELMIGVATATWPGGQTFSTPLQVTHGLTRQATGSGVFTQPLTVVTGSNGPPTSSIVAGATPQQFQIQWFTIDGVNPAAATTMQFYWLAFN